MNDHRKPPWAEGLTRIDRPHIDRRWRPQDGPLDGVLVWQGEEVDRHGEEYHLYIFEEQREFESTGVMVGVPERATLRALRGVANGTRVYLELRGTIPTSAGRDMLDIAVYVEPSSAAPRR
jgi:hypothetical protein